MICGIKISELRSIEEQSRYHQTKLDYIAKKQKSNISILDKNLQQVIANKKIYHNKWKNYHEKRETLERDHQNEKFHKTLTKIRENKSQYIPESPTSKKQHRSTKSHYYYCKKRREGQIESTNPKMVQRLLNITGNINRNKDLKQYNQTRVYVTRLEKFPLIQRLNQTTKARADMQYFKPAQNQTKMKYTKSLDNSPTRNKLDLSKELRRKKKNRKKENPEG